MRAPSIAQLMSRKNQALWAGVALSALVGLGFYFATYKFIESDSRERFANHARNAQNNINARIKSYTNVLRSAASLFRTFYPLTRDQFHAFTGGLALRTHFPAIETMNYAQYVLDADRPAFERRLRDDQRAGKFGGAPFQIVPPGKRPAYSVITFIEPDVPWDSAFGSDLEAKDEARHYVMASSRDFGTMMASGLPVKVISTPSKTGLAMRLPLYRYGMPASNVAERRKAYIGSIGIAFSVPKLIRGVLDEMPIRNVRLTLVDPVPPLATRDAVRDRVLFDSIATDSNPDPAPPAGRNFSKTLPIDFNGQMWTATFSVDQHAMYTGFDMYFPWLAMIAGFISSMLIYALLHTLTSSRINAIRLAEEMTRELRGSQEKLQLSHENLRRLAAHADNIKESERKRIAREIHDDLGQNLLALRIEADMLSSRTRDRHPRLHARALGTLKQIDTTIKSVRQIINDLRPNVLDLGLNAAVDWQIHEFRRLTGIRCELIDSEEEIRASDHCATALFRILQESLSNISRHAHATTVKVTLQVEGEQICMTVSDNGVGLVSSGMSKPGSFGLVGIEERMRILNGTFDITSIPGQGTTVCVCVPVHADANHAGPDHAGMHETATEAIPA